MDEEQYPWLRCHALGLHDIQLYGVAVLGDRPFGRCDTRHIDVRLRLEPCENFLGLRLGQLPEWTAVLVDVREERPNLRIDPWIGRGVRGCCSNLSHEACSKREGHKF